MSSQANSFKREKTTSETVNPPYRPYSEGNHLKLFLDVIPSFFADNVIESVALMLS